MYELDKVQPEINVLAAFASAIVGAFASKACQWRQRLSGFAPDFLRVPPEINCRLASVANGCPCWQWCPDPPS